MENQEKRYRPRVNPKDNTITIKRVKDNFNNLEVSDLLRRFENDYNAKFCKSTTIYCQPDHSIRVLFLGNWIEQNL